MVKLEDLNSLCSAFRADGKNEGGLRFVCVCVGGTNLLFFLVLTSLRCILTDILSGVPSVCGDVDEEDALASEVAETDSAAVSEKLRTVIVDGACDGWKAVLRIQTGKG